MIVLVRVVFRSRPHRPTALATCMKVIRATKSFVIDTVKPEVTITDDQSGKSFDGKDTVAYTLTFTEGVQSVAESDLTVTGATADSVVHTAGDNTATVNVTVDQDSMANVSITVNDGAFLIIAGNPLVEAVDSSQTVDTGIRLRSQVSRWLVML